MFVISGAWHGANLTFVVWGVMHGTLYIIELIINKKFSHYKAPALLGWLYLMSFHTISLIAFRALSVDDLSVIYKKIFIEMNFSDGISQIVALNDRLFFYICIGLIALMFAKEVLEEYSFSSVFEKQKSKWRPVFYFVLLLAIFMLGDFNANEFIYFQFW